LTTAAGAYQITRTTWLDVGGALRFGSFDPTAQDAAAIALIQRRGALPHILAGEPQKAAYALRDEWEMFQQPQWSPEAVAARFVGLGGTIA
jgi:lysozyme